MARAAWISHAFELRDILGTRGPPVAQQRRCGSPHRPHPPTEEQHRQSRQIFRVSGRARYLLRYATYAKRGESAVFKNDLSGKSLNHWA